MIEKIIFNRLFNFLSMYSTIVSMDSEKNHSTEYAALELIDINKKELDAKHDPFAVFLDMSKAFTQ